MPAIKCPACAYETPDEDAAIVAALLQIHLSTAHPPASSQAAQTRGPKLSRPHIDAGVDQETWNTFVRRWQTFRTGSQISDAAASTQLFQCASEALGDTILKVVPDVTSLPVDKVLQTMHNYAVIPVATGVIRAELMALVQGADEQFRTFAARVQGKAGTCGLHTSAKCDCGKTIRVDYTEETVRDVLLAGIADIDIRREALSTIGIQEKSLNDVISFVEGREMARNAAAPSATVSAVRAPVKVATQVRSKPAPCNKCGKTFQPANEKHKLCLECWRASRRRRSAAAPPPSNDKHQDIASVESAFVSQISAVELDHSIISNKNLKKGFSAHPRVGFWLSAMQADGSQSDSVHVDGVADTGAQSNVWGLEEFKKSGLPPDILKEVSMNFRGVNKSKLEIVGAFEARCFGEAPSGDIIDCHTLVYVTPNISGFYMSYDTMVDLLIINRDFPTIGAGGNPKVEVSSPPQRYIRSINRGCGAPEDGSCKCPQRSTVPDRPTSLPFEPIPENIPKMKKWLLDRYGSSTFNTCPHRALPCMAGPPVEIHIEDGVTPRTCHTPAPIPMHWQQRVHDDLIRDEALGVIEKVPYGEPVDWCHRMVVTRKHDGSPRRTVDLSPLNKHCKRETFAAESPFRLARRIPKNTWKTVTDAWNGYHSVPLKEADRHLTTFITPFGRYRYARAPQGFLSSGDGYNRRYDAILSDFPRKERCVDDCLHHDDEDKLEDHWWRTIDFLTLTGSSGIVLNPDKFQFCVRTAEFAGFRVSDENIEPLPKYLDAIRNFPTPKSTSDIRSWFGLVNQVSNYAQLRDTMAPFKPFLSPKYKFFWSGVLEKAFSDSKEAIVDAIHKGVEIFDITKPTCLRPDWSARGIGYFLLQQHCECSSGMPDCCPDGWRITLAGSRFLCGAEQRYAPIEGEALAVAWGLEQTRYFTQGCPKLLVVTDHKPLAKIFGDRTLDEIPNTRLFRLKQRTLPWSFQIAYLPGKTNHAADAASRNPSPGIDDSQVSGEDYAEEVLVTTVTREAEEVTSISWSMIAQETSKDPVLATLCAALLEGFTGQYPSISEYMRYKESMYIVDGVVLYNDRVVIPAALRKRTLETLHSAHQGVSTMQLRAQAIMFWPGMSRDIERTRAGCMDCNKNAPSQAPLPSEPAVPPSTPFEQIFADFFDFAGHHYLIAGDRLSGWPEIFSTPVGSCQAGARGLIACLRKLFDVFGVPEELSSDGGPEFTASVTADFLKRWGVKPRISSAYNPQSNGRAEVAVKSAKRLLRSNIGPTGSLDNDKLLRALLQLRNTPDADCNLSPAQIIYGRPIRDAFAFANRLEKFSNPHIHPVWREAWEAKESALKTRFLHSSESLNEHAKNLPPLVAGDRCFIQNQNGNAPKKWDRTGTVVEVLPHSQLVVKVDGSGRLTKRNRRFVRKFMAASPNIRSAAPPVTLVPSSNGGPADLPGPRGPITPDLISEGTYHVPHVPSVPSHNQEVVNCEPHTVTSPDPTKVVITTPTPATPTQPPPIPPANVPTPTPHREREPLALRRLRPHNDAGLGEAIVGRRGERGSRRRMDLGGM